MAKQVRRKPKGVEDNHLRTYYKWLILKRWDINYHHVGNELPAGDAKMKRFAANLKHKGKKPGFADITILEQKNGYGALFIELKTETGSASLEQLAFLHNVNNNGYLGVVAFGLDAAMKITEWYMNESKEPMPIILKNRKRAGHVFENVKEVYK